MATLTTAEGIEYIFDPSGIAAIRAVDATHADLIGLVKAPLRIPQSAEALIQSLGLTGKFVSLTDAAGDALWFAAGSIAYLRAAAAGDGYAGTVKTMICAGSAIFGVMENTDMAARKSRDAGAKI